VSSSTGEEDVAEC
jgi:hypothetical protein